MSFGETFWATFVGGFAAAVVGVVGVFVVEWARVKQERDREDRARVRRHLERRRASRNAAKAVRMELVAAIRPLVQFISGSAGWEPMPFSRESWNDRENRIALLDLMTDEALLTVDAAYHELGAIRARLSEDASFLQDLARDEGRLGHRILDTHVHPAIEHLHSAIAGTEVLELAALGELEAEAKRIKRGGS